MPSDETPTGSIRTIGDKQLRSELAYQRRKSVNQWNSYAMCDNGCGRGAVGGGYCLACCEAETKRREEAPDALR